MTSPADVAQLYILLSYEKLQRSTISQRQRPTEASLRNRLLVWRFLKKIENEPVPSPIEQPLNSSHTEMSNSDNSPWILDLNTSCDEDEIDMDIESDIVTVVSNSENLTSTNVCDTMDVEQATDVAMLLKRAIGAERRQKSSSSSSSIENLTNENNNNNLSEATTTTSLEDTEQFFHDLCAELTSTTAALVNSSSTSPLICSTTPEQPLIH